MYLHFVLSRPRQCVKGNGKYPQCGKYMVFWHADSADSFRICGICEICVENCQGSSYRHLLSKLCDSLIIIQCGCPYDENRNVPQQPPRFRRLSGAFLFQNSLPMLCDNCHTTTGQPSHNSGTIVTQQWNSRQILIS